MRIFSNEMPSSSAAICASAVVIPCPSSTLPVTIDTVPSRSKCTRWVRRRASDSGSGECGEMRTGLFICGAHDCLHLPVVRAAAAEIFVERLAHLLFTRLLVQGEQGSGRYGNPAHAVAALRRLLGDQRLLHRMQLAIGTQSFDGSDLLADGE